MVTDEIEINASLNYREWCRNNFARRCEFLRACGKPKPCGSDPLVSHTRSRDHPARPSVPPQREMTLGQENGVSKANGPLWFVAHLIRSRVGGELSASGGRAADHGRAPLPPAFLTAEAGRATSCPKESEPPGPRGVVGIRSAEVRRGVSRLG